MNGNVVVMNVKAFVLDEWDLCWNLTPNWLECLSKKRCNRLWHREKLKWLAVFMRNAGKSNEWKLNILPVYLLSGSWKVNGRCLLSEWKLWVWYLLSCVFLNRLTVSLSCMFLNGWSVCWCLTEWPVLCKWLIQMNCKNHVCWMIS